MKKMEKIIRNIRLGICMAAMAAMFVVIPEVKAQEEDGLKIDAGADLVSSYVWRGVYQTGASFQPSLSASFAGLTLGVWGSTDFATPFKEFDFALSYEIAGLSLGITDYWWSGQGEPYFKYKEQHLFEFSVGYYFGDNLPLSLGWNTMFSGDQDKNEDGKQRGSSYFSIGYDFQVKGVECSAEAGITPWKGIYQDKFDLMSLSLKASKKVTITNEFSLPLFAQVILCPAKNDAHLVFGITF